MQVLSLSRKKSVLELPLTKAPINFAVLRSDGLSSNRWGVNTNKNGDAYVYCRDVPGAEKVSLHASGRQHISITRKTAERTGTDNRFGPVWRNPNSRGRQSPRSASYSRRGALGGVRARRAHEGRTIDRRPQREARGGQFFYYGLYEENGGPAAHFVFGQVPLRPGKTLYIIAWKEPQNDLMERIRSVFPKISPTFSELELGEDDYTVCFQGHRGPTPRLC